VNAGLELLNGSPKGEISLLPQADSAMMQRERLIYRTSGHCARFEFRSAYHPVATG
jgi:hypothetical protein